MSELAIVAIVIISAIFVLALIALLLGSPLSFKLNLGWKSANVEFAAHESTRVPKRKR